MAYVSTEENKQYVKAGILAMEEGNYTKAVEWFRKAAENGDADGQNTC